jgi:hypothetical protein
VDINESRNTINDVGNIAYTKIPLVIAKNMREIMFIIKTLEKGKG